MKLVLWRYVLLLVGVVAVPVPAEELGAPAASVETRTEAWLQLQREGRATSPFPQQLTPAERELGMARWLESFKHEIPEFFEQDVAGEVGR